MAVPRDAGRPRRDFQLHVEYFRGRMGYRRHVIVLAALALLAACGDDGSVEDAAGLDASRVDGGIDAMPPDDAGTEDAGRDAVPADAPGPDAGMPDAPMPDAAPDAAPLADAGPGPCPEVCTGGCAKSVCQINGADDEGVACPPGYACVIDCEMAPCTGPVDCDTASLCLVLCRDEGACTGHVRCGTGLCAVSCGAGACSGGVTCGPNECSVACTDDDACPSMIDCGGALNCLVDCSGSGSCSGGIRCGPTACEMTCSGTDSCRSTVDCSTSCACSVMCTGTGSCSSVSCPSGCMAGRGCDTAAAGCSGC